MSHFYDRNYKVKVWINVDGLAKKKTKALLDWFESLEAKIIQWPGQTFKETCEAMKLKGWAHVFEKDITGKITLPSQFLNVAFLEHIRKTNPAAIVPNNVAIPIHRINRVVLEDSDYDRIFSTMALAFEPKAMSFLFDIGKLCHFNEQQVKVFVTSGYAPREVLTGISEHFITIKPEGGDINIKDTKDDEELFNVIIEKLKPLLLNY